MFFYLLGKGLGIWDKYSHSGKTDNNATGDIACDSYHKYREDIKIMKDMKVILLNGKTGLLTLPIDTGMIFFSYLTDFSYFPLKIVIQRCWT